MTRLVAVRVLPDETGNVRLFAAGGATVRREQLIEFVNKLPPPSHDVDQTTDIVWNKESVLPRVCFSECKRNLARVERLEPVAVTAGTHETGCTIENVLVRLRSRAVAFVVLFLTQQARDLGDAPIVVRVFEHSRNRLTLVFRVDETAFDVWTKPVVLQLRAVFHRREGFVQVEAVDAFHCRVRNHGNRVITDHRVSLICSQFPHWQTTALFVLDQESVDEVACAFLIDDGVERVRGPKRVPEREDRVV